MGVKGVRGSRADEARLLTIEIETLSRMLTVTGNTGSMTGLLRLRTRR